MAGRPVRGAEVLPMDTGFVGEKTDGGPGHVVSEYRVSCDFHIVISPVGPSNDL